ncbi:MAG: hypothetical protein PVJ77_26870, partial [Desulfobacterales bacterium]
MFFLILLLTAPLSTSAQYLKKEGAPAPIAAADLYMIAQSEIESYIELAESSQELSLSQKKQVIDLLKAAIRYRELADEYREE